MAASKLEQLSPLSAISASLWADYVEQQNNLRGKKSVMMWEETLPGTEVTDQQPVGLKQQWLPPGFVLTSSDALWSGLFFPALHNSLHPSYGKICLAMQWRE